MRVLKEVKTRMACYETCVIKVSFLLSAQPHITLKRVPTLHSNCEPMLDFIFKRHSLKLDWVCLEPS